MTLTVPLKTFVWLNHLSFFLSFSLFHYALASSNGPRSSVALTEIEGGSNSVPSTHVHFTTGNKAGSGTEHTGLIPNMSSCVLQLWDHRTVGS